MSNQDDFEKYHAGLGIRTRKVQIKKYILKSQILIFIRFLIGFARVVYSYQTATI